MESNGRSFGSCFISEGYMACQVFKDGLSDLVDPEALAGCIAAGWSTVDPNAPLPKGVTVLNEKPLGQPYYVIHDRVIPSAQG
jgi:hypothetical protein